MEDRGCRRVVRVDEQVGRRGDGERLVRGERAHEAAREARLAAAQVSGASITGVSDSQLAANARNDTCSLTRAGR